VRVPPEGTTGAAGAAPAHHHRRQAVVLVVLAGLVLVVVLAQVLARFITNLLWFESVSLGGVWRTITLTKLGLLGVFGGAFFVACDLSLWVVDRVAPRGALLFAPEFELVRRYHAAIGGHQRLVRVAVSLLLGLVMGSGAIGQWRHWLLFSHAVRVGVKDPQFHRDVGFYLFRLPFLSFLVDWTLLALLVLLLVSVFAHFLNGGIRLQGPSPRVDPRATAHLSVVLGLMALVRAAGYYYVDRFGLDVAHDAVVAGAGYTDVHVRLPALGVLSIVALTAFVLLAVNVYQRRWLLPGLAVGLWALLALVLGIIYPAVVQGIDVTPAQSTLELPYIARNIAATRTAMGIDLPPSALRAFPANQDLNAGVLQALQPTISAVQLWDPGIAGQTFEKDQALRSYFTIAGLSVDRYRIGGRVVPTVVGVREVDAAGVPISTWVNTHLQFTHGYGAILAPANEETATGDPRFLVGGLPPTSAPGAPVLDQPRVYYGLGESGFVVVDTRQPELDYQDASGGNVESSYKGGGGVRLSSFWTRLAFAIRFRDFNLLVSNLVTPHSRILFVQDVRAMVATAAPFLRVGSDPYPVLAGGEIDWLVNAYTTSATYPYAQPASTGVLPAGSALRGQSFNYVRNSVKVVVNAYTGRMTFYAVDPSDPVLRAWERVFPTMFKPLDDLPADLRSHLRYPAELLMLQSAMLGRYHVTSPAAFYSAAEAWDLSPEAPTAIPGSSGAPAAGGDFTPDYELLQLPGHTSASFVALEPLVPVTNGERVQELSAFLVAYCDPSRYGELRLYELPANSTVESPSKVGSVINQYAPISEYISYLDQHGSSVTLGRVMVLPLADSVVYVRPLYTSATGNPIPEIQQVLVVYGDKVAMAPTVERAFADLFAPLPGSTTGPSSGTGGGTGSVSARVRAIAQQLAADEAVAKADLAKGDVSGWADEQQAIAQLVSDLVAATAGAPSTPAGSRRTTASDASSASGGAGASRVGVPGSSGGSSTSAASGASAGSAVSSVPSTTSPGAGGTGAPSPTSAGSATAGVPSGEVSSVSAVSAPAA
jgi:uncharacterized membrane protein (UPF0182 family)